MIGLATSDRLGWWRTLSTGLLLGVAAIWMVALLDAIGSERLGYDFRSAYLPAAESVRTGGSPYVLPESPGGDGRLPYVYPPQLAIALVPSTTLPVDVSAFIAFLVCLAALMGALAVVGVRDVRCYAAVLVWAPGWNALETANVSAVLALALAVAWRVRDRTWGSSATLALAVSTKLFLWPLLVWAVATGRARTAAMAVAIGSAVTLAAWASIGLDGLDSFPDQLGLIELDDSYSIVAVANELGLETVVGRALMVLVGGGLLAACVAFGRSGDERRALTCGIAAALALTPVVWLHYLVLLVVPLALARPRLSAVWLLPVVLWASPRAGNGDGFETILPAVVAAIVVAVALARSDAGGSASGATPA